jgi:hypothetical protein
MTSLFPHTLPPPYLISAFYWLFASQPLPPSFLSFPVFYLLSTSLSVPSSFLCCFVPFFHSLSPTHTPFFLSSLATSLCRKPDIATIPDYPGPLPRKPPAPPKYLVQVVDNGAGGKKNQLIQVKGTAPEIRPQGLTDSFVPVTAKISNAIRERDVDTPAHFFPPRQEYVPPDVKNKARDSRIDVKSSSISLKQSSPSVNLPALPKNPTVPAPYVSPPVSSYQGGPLLHARTAAGQILGTGTIN